jgi:hypothetical protein
MLFILKWLRRLWPRRIAPKIAMPPPLPAAPAPVVSTPIVTEITANRHERRRLERARRKYDKFVTPKGVLPETEKSPREPKPRTKKVEVIGPGDPFDDPRSNELLIVDSHHENRSDLVAYKEAELQGEFNFRDTILQQLERYFVYIERMKKHDADAYGFYREVGATLLPYIATGAWNRERTSKNERCKHTTPLADWFNRTRPAFGCFCYGTDPETERYEKVAKGKNNQVLWVPKFMYFTKYRQPPPEVQFITGGDIYKMTIWWDRPFDKKMHYGHPQEFAIYISADGKEMIALRVCDTKHIEIHSPRVKKSFNRTGHYTRGPALRRRDIGGFAIPKRAWHIPGEFEKWAKESGDDVQHFLTELFRDAVYRNEMTQYSMTRITATKDDVTATFAVNIHRTGYFFQDRDVHLNAEGSRKRIFHFVRPHVRADGTEVKAHFRGEREFDWAGYHVRITIPGRDHFHLADFDVGSIDGYWEEPGQKYIYKPELGKRLKGMMDQGVGGAS